MEQWEKEYLEAIQKNKKDEAQQQKELRKEWNERLKQTFKRNRKKLCKPLVRSLIGMVAVEVILFVLAVAVTEYLALCVRDEKIFETFLWWFKCGSYVQIGLWMIWGISRYCKGLSILINTERLKWFLTQ